MCTVASGIQASQRLSDVLLVPRHHRWSSLQLPGCLPGSRPGLSQLLDPSPFLQLVRFRTVSLIPQNHPDLRQECYLNKRCPLCRVMVKYIPLARSARPPSGLLPCVAHARPAGQILLMRSWSGSSVSHPALSQSGALHSLVCPMVPEPMPMPLP